METKSKHLLDCEDRELLADYCGIELGEDHYIRPGDHPVRDRAWELWRPDHPDASNWQHQFVMERVARDVPLSIFIEEMENHLGYDKDYTPMLTAMEKMEVVVAVIKENKKGMGGA